MTIATFQRLLALVDPGDLAAACDPAQTGVVDTAALRSMARRALRLLMDCDDADLADEAEALLDVIEAHCAGADTTRVRRVRAAQREARV